jgi:hypothetical protein
MSRVLSFLRCNCRIAIENSSIKRFTNHYILILARKKGKIRTYKSGHIIVKKRKIYERKLLCIPILGATEFYLININFEYISFLIFVEYLVKLNTEKIHHMFLRHG